MQNRISLRRLRSKWRVLGGSWNFESLRPEGLSYRDYGVGWVAGAEWMIHSLMY